MAKSKEQCMAIVAEKFDENNLDSNAQVLVTEEIIKEITGAEFGFLYAYNNEKNRLIFLNNEKKLTLKMKSSILKEVLLSQKSFFDNRVVSYKNYNTELDNPLNIKIKSLIIVPVLDKSKTNVLGFMLACNSVNHMEEFKRYDTRCLTFLNTSVLKTVELLNQNYSKTFSKPSTTQLENNEELLSKLEQQEQKIKELEAQIEHHNQIKHETENMSSDVLVIDETLYQEEKKSRQLKDILEFLTNEVTYLANEEHKIYLLLEIIKNSLHNKDQLHFINEMLNQSQFIHTLANDLYSREKMPLVLDEFNPFQMVNDLSNLYGQTFRNEEITLNVFVDSKIPNRLISEMMKIKSLIIHLINNVYGFLNSEGTIELSFNYIEESEVLTIEVKGISHPVVKSIQSLFQHTVVSHSLTSSDRGLGLSVSSNLINILNGTLKILTTRDDEHSFQVAIPVKVGDAADKKSVVSSKIFKIAILMDDANMLVCQNLIRYCINFGIEEEDIFVFRNYKKMKNIKFTHLFCFENMLSKPFNSNDFSSLIILKYSILAIEKNYFNNKNIYELYVNSYYGLELQKILFPASFNKNLLSRTLLMEDSFLLKFNNVIKRLKTR